MADTPPINPLLITNKAGDTPLHVAVQERRSAVALMLLEVDPSRGHDLNERRETPLDVAASEGLVHVVRKILECPGCPGSVSSTTLQQGVLGGHIRKQAMSLHFSCCYDS